MNNKQSSQLIGLFLRRTCTILLGIGLCLTSCTDDPLEPDGPDGSDDMEMSLVSCIEFDNSKLEGSVLLQKDEVICCFKMVDPDTTTFEIIGTCRELRGKEEITLEKNLPIGDMYITHIKYHGERDKPGSELRSYGLGYLLHVKGTGKKTKISVDGTYDEQAGFVGTGTAESPYKINCGEDLLHLQGLVNKDITGGLFKGVHFMQTTNIDMHAVCTFLNGEYGWLPIGYTNNRPFRGYYHGTGLTISRMWMKRPDTTVGGLFGCLYGALIDSIHFTNIDITVEAIAGVVAGAVVAAGNDNTPGGSIVSSHIKGCTVKNSRINSSVATGMIIGMADPNSRLLVEECNVDNTNRITTQGERYGIGGFVGLGAFTSSVHLSKLNNSMNLSSSMGAVGGIIGTSDTLTAVNCVNTGTITQVSTTDQERYGTGGIAGGTGCGQFINCINKASINGDRGTGGILGSALLDKGDGTIDKPGLYNNALFLTCLNEGNISGKSYAGGICGEAQACVLSSSNSGNIYTSGGYTGGIVGVSPAAALYDCTNTGKVTASKIAGGINAFSVTSTAALCLNFGEVITKEGYAGGIMGLGGGGAMLHYCGNYGNISTSGFNGPVGGVIGELGKVREWKAMDVVSVVMGVIGIVSSSTAIGVNSAFVQQKRKLGQDGNFTDLVERAELKATIKQVSFKFMISDITLGLANGALGGFDVYARIHPSVYSIQRAVELKADFTNRSSFLRDSLSTASRNRMEAFHWTSPKINTGIMQINQSESFQKQRTTLTDNKEKLTQMNDNIDLRRANLQESADKEKELNNKVFDILSGVLTAVSVLLFGLSFITGAAPIVGIIAGVTGVISSSSSIAKTAMDYQSNATEISQCYNYGTVKGGEYNGGIVGHLNDYSFLYDCYNGGSLDWNNIYPSSSYGTIVGESGDRVVIANTLNTAFSTYPHNADTPKNIGFRKNAKRIEHNLSIFDLKPAELGNKSSKYYKGWDFDTTWNTPVYDSTDKQHVLPTLNQSTYANSK